jgi:hypothetical protein
MVDVGVRRVAVGVSRKRLSAARDLPEAGGPVMRREEDRRQESGVRIAPSSQNNAEPLGLGG